MDTKILNNQFNIPGLGNSGQFSSLPQVGSGNNNLSFPQDPSGIGGVDTRLMLSLSSTPGMEKIKQAAFPLGEIDTNFISGNASNFLSGNFSSFLSTKDLEKVKQSAFPLGEIDTNFISGKTSGFAPGNFSDFNSGNFSNFTSGNTVQSPGGSGSWMDSFSSFFSELEGLKASFASLFQSPKSGQSEQEPGTKTDFSNSGSCGKSKDAGMNTGGYSTDNGSTKTEGKSKTEDPTKTEGKSKTEDPTKTEGKSKTEDPTKTERTSKTGPTAMPEPKGEVTVNEPIVVKAGEVFDGGGKLYKAGPALGDGGQSENQKPVFIIEPGGKVQNLQYQGADGIHTKGDATIEDVWCRNAGEDAMTMKGPGNVTWTRGGIYGAEDKAIQINAGGSLTVEDATFDGFGKAIRTNGGKDIKVDILVKNSHFQNGKEAIVRTDSPSATVKLQGVTFDNVPNDVLAPPETKVEGAVKPGYKKFTG